MEALTNINVIKQLLSEHGFTFSKAKGQNFLINASVCPRMAEAAIENDHTAVIEIGPGIGVLTKELALRAKKVIAIEIDERLRPILDITLAEFANIEVLYGDVLNIDLAELIAQRFSGFDVVICANLPYYITSPIIMKLLEDKLPIKSITVMVQREAADRLCADIGKRECGAVSVAVSYYSMPLKLFSVSRGSFLPAPNVDSTVMKLAVRSTMGVAVSNEKQFFRVVKAAFSQRRKNLHNALSAGLCVNKSTIGDALTAAGIPLTARAEELSLEQFGKIADALNQVL